MFGEEGDDGRLVEEGATEALQPLEVVLSSPLCSSLAEQRGFRRLSLTRICELTICEGFLHR
jgi:hypothetical protein